MAPTSGFSRTVDAHAHIWPDERLGTRWLKSVGLKDFKRTGTLAEWLGLMEEAGVDQAILLLYLRPQIFVQDFLSEGLAKTDARRRVLDMIRVHNRWGCELGQSDPRFLPFIGIDVRFMSEEDALREIDELLPLGARGVKIVPPSMELYADDPLLRPVLRRCAELGLPVLSQSGHSPGPQEGADAYGRPGYFRAVLEEAPELRLILAHMGRGYEDDVVGLVRDFPHVFTDTSHRLTSVGKPGHPSAEELVALIRRIGVNRVMFGTNYPITSPVGYVQILDELPLTDEERASIRGENLHAFMATSRPGVSAA